MNTVEELFKAATQAMEEKVFLPTVMAKLAERGYQATTQEEVAELVKHAEIIRQGVLSGEIMPVPAAQLSQQGQITKEASEKIAGDFMAFAPEVQINLNDVEPIVKEAATILTWGYLQAQKEQAATK